MNEEEFRNLNRWSLPKEWIDMAWEVYCSEQHKTDWIDQMCEEIEGEK